MKYDPMSYTHRAALAQGVLATVKDKGFLPQPVEGCREEVYGKRVNQRIQIRVYTSIEGGEVRDCGDDAIRVCTVYSTNDGGVRGVGRETRVNRVGDINAIVVRLAERIATSLAAVKEIPCCEQCGAPKFKSKKGNMVCADLCWKRW